MVNCRYCDEQNGEGATYCHYCGGSLAVAAATVAKSVGVNSAANGDLQQARACPACGQLTKLSGKFCTYCGTVRPSQQGSLEPTIQPGMPTLAPASIGTQAQLHLVFRSVNRVIHVPQRPEVLIGRSEGHDPRPELDIDLAPFGGGEKGVSRHHARLVMSDTKLMLKDLGSTNGTTINKQQLAPNGMQQLHNGDEIGFGDLITFLRFSL